MAPPFRAEHVGSLLRPASLARAFRDHNAAKIDDKAFVEAQDAAIRDVVALQEAAGLKLVTDGEFRRGSYWGHFIGPVEGLTVKPAAFSFHDEAGAEQAFIAPHVAGPVSRTQGISTGEFQFLKSVAKATPKVTLPSPPTFHFWRGKQGIEASAYADAEAFFDDFAAVYRQEIAALAALGATYMTLDEVPLVMLCDEAIRAQVSDWGEDSDRLIDLYITAINKAVAERPAGVTIGMHLCRGNFKGKFLSEGGYEPVADRLFNEIDVDAFFLEYDTTRAGDFAPLRFVPEAKHVVLGLVSSKNPVLEDIDALCRRIDEAASVMALDRLAVSPQCGFASAVSGNPITVDDEKRKLALVVETAIRMWGEA